MDVVWVVSSVPKTKGWKGYTLLTLSQVKEETTMVSDLKKSRRELTSWSRQNLRMGWCNHAKITELPFQRASQIVRQNDPDYRADLDIIDAVIRHAPDELSSDDEDKAAGIGMKIPTKRGARGTAYETQKTERGLKTLKKKTWQGHREL